MRAIKIIMRNDTNNSNSPKDIVGIFVESDLGNVQEYGIEKLYNLLMESSSRKIFVGNSTSYLIPLCAMNGQRYVRAIPNFNTIDELMKLPRCYI